MNKFLTDKIEKAIKKTSSEKYKSYILNEAYLLNKLGISNENDLVKFHYIAQYVPIIIKRIKGTSNLNNILSENLLNNLDKINSTDDIFNKAADFILSNGLLKYSYPNYSADLEPIKDYNMSKWKSALNDIVIRARIYNNFTEAFNYATRGWTDMTEKSDFESWVGKKLSGIDNLYKAALFGNSMPIELQNIPGLIDNRDRGSKELEPKKVYSDDDIRKKVLSRITSIKRILSTRDGRAFIGSDYNKILRALLELEGDIFRIKSASMIGDLIVRAQSSLKKDGCDDKFIKMFQKLGQLPPLDMPPMDPNAGIDAMSDPDPSMGASPKEEGESGDSGKEAIQQFILNMKGYKNKDMTPKAIKERMDKLVDNMKKNPPKSAPVNKPKASWFNIETRELKAFETLASGINKIATDLVSLGQAVPDEELNLETEPAPEKRNVPKVEPAFPSNNINDTKPIDAEKLPPKNIDVENIEENKPDKLESFKLDTKNEIRQKDPIDAAFNDIKISDVITRLEALSRVFKNREIARQLSIIDIMLDRLGLSGFFPALAEATRSALESNQYCQTRIEEVLSRLVSATDISGRSIIDQNLLEPDSKNNSGKTGPDNMIDKEVAGYLNEVPTESSEAKPVGDISKKPKLPEEVKPESELAPRAPEVPKSIAPPPAIR